MRVSPGGGLRPASLPAGERNPRTAAWEERGDGLDRRPLASSPGGGRHSGPKARGRRIAAHVDGSPLGAASTKPHGATGKGTPTSGPLRCFHKSLIVRSVNWPTLKWPAGSGALLVISGASAEAPNPDASPATSASSLSRDRLQMNGRPAASPASRAPSTGVGEAAEIRRGTETHHPSPGGQCLAKRA